MPHGDEAQKRSLLQLVAELEAALAQAPPEHAAAVAKVARSLAHLSAEVQDEKPDKEMIRITGEGLKRRLKIFKRLCNCVDYCYSNCESHAQAYFVAENYHKFRSLFIGRTDFYLDDLTNRYSDGFNSAMDSTIECIVG